MPPKGKGVSRVQTNGGKDPGSSYRDNKDGTIHVTHHEGKLRESYDVEYGKDADNQGNAIEGTYHITEQ